MTGDTLQKGIEIRDKIADITILVCDLKNNNDDFIFSFTTTDSIVRVDDEYINPDIRLYLKGVMLKALEEKKEELIKLFDEL